MFNNLSMKLKTCIMCSIGIILLFLMLLIYVSFYGIIHDDFTLKTVQFIKQQCKSTETKMLLIEKNINLMIDQLHIKDVMQSEVHSADFMKNLTYVRSYYPYLNAFFISMNNIVYYYYYADFDPDMGNLRNFFEKTAFFDKLSFNERNSCWIIENSPMSNNSYMLYIKKLTLDNGNSFYLATNVEKEYLFQYFSFDKKFIQQDSIHLVSNNNKRISLLLNDSKRLSYDLDNIEICSDSYEFLGNDVLAVSYYMPEVMITVYSINHIRYINKVTMTLSTIFLLFFLIVIIISYIVLIKLNRSLITPLKQLHKSMQEYI